jgi:fructokinase
MPASMIVCCGEALIDFVPILVDGKPAYRPLPGGSPFNVAIGLGRLGAPTAFFSRLSSDFFGDLLVHTLAENGVDGRYLRRAADPSTLAFVSPPSDGEPQYAFYANGAADRSMTTADLPPQLDADVTCLHFSFGAITLLVEPAASALGALMRREAAQRLIVLDPNIRAGLIPDRIGYRRKLEEWVAAAGLVKVSRADLEWLYPERTVAASAAAWRGLGPRLVVVTLGAEGAMALMDDTEVTVPGRKVAVVDTVGAGDSFHAALLAGLESQGALTKSGLAHLPVAALEPLLARAVAAAGITCSRAGANPPTLAELERAL